jgi:hypothetical protein
MDDWEPGDLALCVRGGPPIRPFKQWAGENGADYDLVPGRIYTVDRVDHEWGFVGLHFEGYDWSWLASRFRKIRPHTPDEEDREVIELLTKKREPVQ